MKKLLLVAGLAAGLAGGGMALTYPRYRREMRGAKARLPAGSRILQTGHGELEYAVLGEGRPALLLHGAGGGYDQGLWLGKLALGDGYKFVAVSRYGYLRTPIPPNASIQRQAAAYRDLLDGLNVQKVVVVGVSAGGPSAMQFAKRLL